MDKAEQTAERPVSAPEAAPATASDAQPEAAALDASVEAEEAGSEFSALRARLEEIASAVTADDISLDDALDLYEEAAKLGAQATDALEGEATYGNVG